MKQLKRQMSKDFRNKSKKKDHQTMTWLHAEIDDQNKSCVYALVCHLSRVQNENMGAQNFLQGIVNGSGNHKTSNITDHTNSEPHKAAMMYFIPQGPGQKQE